MYREAVRTCKIISTVWTWLSSRRSQITRLSEKVNVTVSTISFQPLLCSACFSSSASLCQETCLRRISCAVRSYRNILLLSPQLPFFRPLISSSMLITHPSHILPFILSSTSLLPPTPISHPPHILSFILSSISPLHSYVNLSSHYPLSTYYELSNAPAPRYTFILSNFVLQSSTHFCILFLSYDYISAILYPYVKLSSPYITLSWSAVVVPTFISYLYSCHEIFRKEIIRYGRTWAGIRNLQSRTD